mgnify:CR=1 FL=1
MIKLFILHESNLIFTVPNVGMIINLKVFLKKVIASAVKLKIQNFILGLFLIRVEKLVVKN